MALHLNSYGLTKNGFKLIASYNCFSKNYFDHEENRWRYECTTIECWKSDKQFLVRQIGKRGRVWDNVYNDKDKANNSVKYLFGLHEFHKKIY